MSETNAVTVDGAAGGSVVLDPKDPGYKAEQIQSEKSAKAMHDFLERATSMTADLGNKLDALAAVQKTQSQTNRFVDSRPELDDVRVSCARSIHDLYGAQGGGQLYNDVIYVADRLYMEHQLDVLRASRNGEQKPTIQKCRLWPTYERLLSRAAIWSTGGSGAGTEWIPTGVSSQRIPLYRMPSRVASLFPQVQIRSMKRLDFPTVISSGAVTVVSQATGTTMPPASLTSNNPGTGALTIQPVKHGTPAMGVNREMIEDSPTDIIDALTEDAAAALMHAQAAAIINGQPTNSSDLDSSNQATNPTILTPANGYATSTAIGYGLRYFAIFAGGAGLTQDCGGTALTLANWETGWGLLHNYALDPSVAYIGSVKTVVDLSSDSNVRSYFNYGPGNPLPIGAVGRLHGVPIVPDQNFPGMLATGKVGAASNTFTGGLFVVTNRWRVGVARDIEVKVWDLPQDDLVGIRGFARHGIGAAPPATDDIATMLINITG